MLFAEVVTEVGSGAVAGWTSFGLAGLILAWLFLKHLPAKDEQIKGLIDRHDSRIDSLAKTFSESLDKVVQHCKDEMEIAAGRKSPPTNS